MTSCLIRVLVAMAALVCSTVQAQQTAPFAPQPALGAQPIGAGRSAQQPGGTSQIGAERSIQQIFGAQQPGTGQSFSNGDSGGLGTFGAGKKPTIAPEDSAAASTPADPRSSLPRPVTVRNEFQEFVAQSTGKRLPIFGQDLFANPAAYRPVEAAPVSGDYVVGPGDEILIRTWGMIDADLRQTVDRNGLLTLPKVGAIPVAGVRFQELPDLIRRELSKLFRNFELSVTMGQLRGIEVFVVGHAVRPGSFTVSSMSTLVNALFATGGPSGTGSMRRIQLKRGNALVTEFDLYDLLLKGDTGKDVRLRQGDVIFIPPVGAQVAIDGSVLNPGIYEAKEGVTLDELLQMAGGLSIVASGSQVAVERIVERKTRRVAEFPLDAGGRSRGLQSGDLVRVFPIPPKFDNAITLRGNVAAPYRAPWREGMRVRDLIPDKEALITRDYWQRLNQQAAVSIDTGVQLKNNVKKLVEEINWDYAVIQRMNPVDLTPLLIPFNLGQAILGGDPQHNLLLKPQDVVTVFSKGDIAVPEAKRTKFVRLEGELATPGVYQIQPGENLRQLLARVGGVTPSAYLFGAEFTRESTRALQQKQLEESIARLEEEAQRAALEKSRKAISTEDTQALQQQTAAQQAFIARLKKTQATGRIVLEVSPENPQVRDLPDMALEDGDRLSVPPKPSVVNVFGSVFGQSAFIYKDSKRLSDYLALAGGATRTADESSIYLLRADGSVASQRQQGWFGGIGGERIMPGDTIVIPEDFERVGLTKELKDWSQILYQFALGVAGLKVLRD